MASYTLIPEFVLLTLLRDVPQNKEYRKSDWYFVKKSWFFATFVSVAQYRYCDTFALSILKNKEQRHLFFLLERHCVTLAFQK